MKNSTLLICIISALLLSTSCSKDGEQDNDQRDFDRTKLLTDLSVNIEHSYSLYLESLVDLESKADAFSSSPGIVELNEFRESWRQSLIKWQGVAPFDFGLAEQISLSTANIYPADTEQIEANILSGDYVFDTPVNLASSGFQALDYLIHGTDDESTIALFTSATDADARKQYVSDIIDNLRLKAELVQAQWLEEDDFRQDFISNSGTDLGSSLGVYLNAFNKSYEKSTRTNKVGVPTGALTFSQTPNPTTVEAYYENVNSVAYLKESLQVFKKLYLGAEGDDSLEEYLQFLDARHGTTSLDEAIKAQLTVSENALNQLEDPLSEFVVDDQQTALEVYSELQNLVVLWKVDMLSALGVLITYQDTDGD